MALRGWVVLALLPGVARADTFFTANLTGAQEVPPSGSAATGFGGIDGDMPVQANYWK